MSSLFVCVQYIQKVSCSSHQYGAGDVVGVGVSYGYAGCPCSKYYFDAPSTVGQLASGAMFDMMAQFDANKCVPCCVCVPCRVCALLCV